MKKFILEIDTDNDAFGSDPTQEIVRLLRKAAEVIETNGEAPEMHRHLNDVNGNVVGSYVLKELWGS